MVEDIGENLNEIENRLSRYDGHLHLDDVCDDIDEYLSSFIIDRAYKRNVSITTFKVSDVISEFAFEIAENKSPDYLKKWAIAEQNRWDEIIQSEIPLKKAFVNCIEEELLERKDDVIAYIAYLALWERAEADDKKVGKQLEKFDKNFDFSTFDENSTIDEIELAVEKATQLKKTNKTNTNKG